ncbi:MAG: alpha/beta hydrolase fold protein [Caulobacter sp.]|nr:alpha/beta hydrolase fold protein [Caulobacter sp.]
MSADLPPADAPLHAAHGVLPVGVGSPLAPFNGAKPPAPAWFEAAIAHEPERGFVEVQGAKIEVLTWGEVGRPGLLFVHGNGAHADWWSFIAPFFADEWRVAAISWSGMGASDWRDHYSGDLFGEEIFAACEASGLNAGPVKPLVVAHSFGGFVTLLAAALHGDRLRAVVTADSPIRPPGMEWKGPPQRGGGNRTYDTAQEALNRFRLAPPQDCANLYIADFIARRSIKPVEGGFTWKFDPYMWRQFEMEERGPLLENLKCPVALMWGDRSNLFGPDIQAYVKSIAPPNTPMVVIPDADHHVMIDQPLAFVAALRGLLAGWDI